MNIRFIRLLIIISVSLAIVIAEAILFYLIITRWWTLLPGWIQLIGYILMTAAITGAPVFTAQKLMKVEKQRLFLIERTKSGE